MTSSDHDHVCRHNWQKTLTLGDVPEIPQIEVKGTLRCCDFQKTIRKIQKIEKVEKVKKLRAKSNFGFFFSFFSIFDFFEFLDFF